MFHVEHSLPCVILALCWQQKQTAMFHVEHSRRVSRNTKNQRVIRIFVFLPIKENVKIVPRGTIRPERVPQHRGLGFQTFNVVAKNRSKCVTIALQIKQLSNSKPDMQKDNQCACAPRSL